MTPLIIFFRTIQQNVAYGCHTELLARFNLSIFTRRRDCLTSGQSLTTFIDPNWDNNIVHKSQMRVNETHSPVPFQFESTTGLGHTHEYSTSLTHSSRPQAKQPMFQQKTTNEIHESQHTLTLPLDSWLNPGMLTSNSERYRKPAH